MIDVEIFHVGHLDTNCYILTDAATNRRSVIDPGYKSSQLKERIIAMGTDTFDYILLTHGHFDHIWYVDELKALTGASVAISSLDEPFLSDGSLNLSAGFRFHNFPVISADITLKDGDTVSFGETQLSFMSTPGHTVGSGCFIDFKARLMFSGDTLFRGSMGRTDFVTGSEADMQKSLRRLANLQGDFTVYPGHGPATNLEYERNFNPYVRAR